MYHPSYYYIEKLGCSDPVKVSAAFYVYLELLEAKRYWNVKYKFEENLDLLYLEVQKKRNSETELFVPWPTANNITLDKIEKIQKALNSNSVTLAFKSEDSTSVMYKVTEGLMKPVSPEVSKIIKEKEERKLELEKEIRRNSCYLYELATSLSNNGESNSSIGDVTETNEDANA